MEHRWKRALVVACLLTACDSGALPDRESAPPPQTSASSSDSTPVAPDVAPAPARDAPAPTLRISGPCQASETTLIGEATHQPSSVRIAYAGERGLAAWMETRREVHVRPLDSRGRPSGPETVHRLRPADTVLELAALDESFVLFTYARGWVRAHQLRPDGSVVTEAPRFRSSRVGRLPAFEFRTHRVGEAAMLVQIDSEGDGLDFWFVDATPTLSVTEGRYLNSNVVKGGDPIDYRVVFTPAEDVGFVSVTFDHDQDPHYTTWYTAPRSRVEWAATPRRTYMGVIEGRPAQLRAVHFDRDHLRLAVLRDGQPLVREVRHETSLGPGTPPMREMPLASLSRDARAPLDTPQLRLSARRGEAALEWWSASETLAEHRWSGVELQPRAFAREGPPNARLLRRPDPMDAAETGFGEAVIAWTRREGARRSLFTQRVRCRASE